MLFVFIYQSFGKYLRGFFFDEKMMIQHKSNHIKNTIIFGVSIFQMNIIFKTTLNPIIKKYTSDILTPKTYYYTKPMSNNTVLIHQCSTRPIPNFIGDISYPKLKHSIN